MSWQMLQPSFGASLEDELFAELDGEEKKSGSATAKLNESDSDDSDDDESEEEEEEPANRQPWTHLCVLDFEACRERVDGHDEEWFYEVTELPVEDRFHRYCRPERISPQVLQRYVDGKYGGMGQAEAWRESAVSLPTALRQLEQWLAEKGLLPADDADDGEGEDERVQGGSFVSKFAFVTCGDWDLKNMLPRNCDLLGVPVPWFMREWSNIKAVYHKFYNTRRPPAGMTTMLKELDIPLEGVHHQGKDDANNIAKVAARMITDGCTFFITGRESDMWHRGKRAGPAPVSVADHDNDHDDLAAPE